MEFYAVELKKRGIDPLEGHLGEPNATSTFGRDMTHDTIVPMSHVDPLLDRARRLAGLKPGRKPEVEPTSPFWEFDRDVWGTLAQATPLPLKQRDIERLRGLGDRINLDEVAQVYLPRRACSTSTSPPAAPNTT